MTILYQPQRHRYSIPYLRGMGRNNWHSTQPANPRRTGPARDPPGRRPNLQRDRHRPRLRNNLLHSNAHHNWGIWQLIGPPNNRCSRHSIPTNKQHKLLTPPTVIPPTTRLIHRGSWRWHRLNRVPTPSRQSSPRRSLSRPGYLLTSPSRSLLHPRGH